MLNLLSFSNDLPSKACLFRRLDCKSHIGNVSNTVHLSLNCTGSNKKVSVLSPAVLNTDTDKDFVKAQDI